MGGMKTQATVENEIEIVNSKQRKKKYFNEEKHFA